MAACRAASAPLPSVYAVRVDDATVSLLLAPSVAEPVGEWRTEDDGATWSRDDFEATEALADETSPYPALVSLGVDRQGSDVLVDLESAGGVVAIEGDPHIASEVAAAIALQSGTASWAADMRVTASGLPAGLAGIGDERIRIVDDLAVEVDALEQSPRDGPRRCADRPAGSSYGAPVAARRGRRGRHRGRSRTGWSR